jgi:hypothetical protein
MQTKTSTKKQLNNFIEFRQSIYEQAFVQEQDALYELVEAMLLSPSVRSFPELSQSPVFQRGWASAYKAIERGAIDEEWLHIYLIKNQSPGGTTVWALDTSVWPRPSSRTLADLRYEQSPTQATEAYSTVKGYAYSSLAWIPQRGGSWALPVDTRRVVGEQTAVAVGVEQVTTLCEYRPTGVVDVIVADGAYGNHRFLGPLKDQLCTVIVRLRCDRVLYGPPSPYQGWGRPRKHGERFGFKEPETWGPPVATMQFTDEYYGQVRLRTWHGLHAKQDANTPFSVLLAEIHLERDKPPKPLWLAYQNAPEQCTLRDIWTWFDRRRTIEPAYRFHKQRLYWTLPQFQQPDRCDRWTLLVDIAYWHIFLARELVSDQPLPWQKPQTVLTPGRVTLGLGALFAQIGLVTGVPQTRGKSPGWPSGRTRTRPKRFTVLKRGHKSAQNG